MTITITISVKDIVWRMEHPDDIEIPEHLSVLEIMWIDEYISIWKQEMLESGLI